MRKLTMLLFSLLAFVGVVRAQITTLGALSNEKAYEIKGERGFIAGNEGYVMGSNHGPISGQTFDATNLDHQFAILNNGENYYLYNIGAKMFAARSGNKAMLTPYPVHTIAIEEASVDTTDYDWIIKLDGKYLNLSSSSDNGVYTNYDEEDAGNRWSITEIADFVDTDAMAVFALGHAQERHNLYEVCIKAEVLYKSMSDKTIPQATTLAGLLTEAKEYHGSAEAKSELLVEKTAALNKAVALATSYLGGYITTLTPGRYAVYYEDAKGTKHYLWNNKDSKRVLSTTEPKTYDVTVGNTSGFSPYAYFFDMDKSRISNPTDNDAMEVQVEAEGSGNGNYEGNRVWDSQVVFKNADGKYAIRSTNCVVNSGWRSDAFITISEDGTTVSGVQNAANAEDVYKWIIEEVEATIGEMGYTTLNAALNAAKDGETVTLLKDVTTSEIVVIDKAITLDGKTKTLTSTAGRAINVTGADGVTIKNLYIDAKGERGINIIQNATNVTINSVTAKAANYAVNVASSAPNAKVIIYSSYLTGLNVVNIAAAGAQVTVDYCTLVCNDQSDAEGYAALCLGQEADGASISATDVTFNITCDEATPSHKAKCNVATGSITIGGSEDEVKKAVAVVEYLPGPYYYAFSSLQAAFDKAKEGETVKLVNDVVVDEAVKINKLVTLDFNGFEITPADNFSASAFEVTGELCFKNKVEGSIADGLIYYIINDADYKAEAGKTFNLTENKEGVNIVYKRTFSHDGWQVLYVPFDIPYDYIAENDHLGNIKVYSITGISNNAVELSKVSEETETLDANTPYIIRLTDEEKLGQELYISGAAATTLYKPANKPYTATYGDYTITGTYTSKAIAAGEEYVLTNGKWCQLTEQAVTDGNNILGAFRVYLTANGEKALSEVRFVINNSDATAIDELKAENGNVKAEVYDLSGRRVEKAEKGIFVVNGKKVVK